MPKEIKFQTSLFSYSGHDFFSVTPYTFYIVYVPPATKQRTAKSKKVCFLMRGLESSSLCRAKKRRINFFWACCLLYDSIIKTHCTIYFRRLIYYLGNLFAGWLAKFYINLGLVDRRRQPQQLQRVTMISFILVWCACKTTKSSHGLMAATRFGTHI